MLVCSVLLLLASISNAKVADFQNHDNSLSLNSEISTIECDQEYSCANCTAVRICRRNSNGTMEKLLEFGCAKDHPYCDPQSGTCSKTSNDIQCNPKSFDFLCPADGYFPNPVDCTKYYVCINGVAYIGDCGPGVNYYNAKSENCHYTCICYTINCAGKSGIKVAYGNDKSFFGYCYNNSLIMFDKCPGKFILDETQQICVPTCTGEGYQGDPYDCSKYYKCSFEKSSVSLTLTHLQCPNNELFDALNSRCAPKRPGLKCSSGLLYCENGEFNFVGKKHLYTKKNF